MFAPWIPLNPVAPPAWNSSRHPLWKNALPRPLLTAMSVWAGPHGKAPSPHPPDDAAQAGRVGACLVLQSVTPIPQQPEKPHYQAHPGFVSRIDQRGIFAEDNSGNLGGPSTQPAVRYRNDAVFLARTR